MESSREEADTPQHGQTPAGILAEQQSAKASVEQSAAEMASEQQSAQTLAGQSAAEMPAEQQPAEPEPPSLWHESFYDLMKQRLSHLFQIVAEYLLSMRPRRVDLLLLKRQDAADLSQATLLRGLWMRLSPIILLEFKSPSRGFRRGDLMRLVSYGAEYDANHWKDVDAGGPLSLVLVMPRLNQTFREELAARGLELEPLGGGYGRIRGNLPYATFVAITNEVADSEDDDYLRVFSDREVKTPQTMYWMRQFFLEKAMPELKDREGYDELLEKFVESLPPEDVLKHFKPEERLRGLGPEQVLKHFKPEERLQGLGPEEAVLALPVEVLRGLSKDYIATLPEHVQRVVRERLGH